jgi:glycyl-tRNA synthetase beta chain
MSDHRCCSNCFVEELPPKALKKLGEAFAGTCADGLRSEGLLDDRAANHAFATPRRLAAHVTACARWRRPRGEES